MLPTASMSEPISSATISRSIVDIFKSYNDTLQNENKETKLKMSPNIDDAVNNDELLDLTSDNSSLPISSSNKRKLLHNNIEHAEKKVPTTKFNALKNDNNEVISTEHLSDGNSYNNNNENSIKFIRNRRLKILYLKIPNHESGKYIKPKGTSFN